MTGAYPDLTRLGRRPVHKNLVHELAVAGHRRHALLHDRLNSIEESLELVLGIDVYEWVIAPGPEPLSVHDLEPAHWGKEFGVVPKNSA